MVMVYSRISPGATEPPFKSITVFVDVFNTGSPTETDADSPVGKVPVKLAVEKVAMISALLTVVVELGNAALPATIGPSMTDWLSFCR